MTLLGSIKRLGRKVRRAVGFSPIPWQGTDYIERRFHAVRNALVDIHLFGVAGVSPPSTSGRSQMNMEKADEYLAKGRETLAWLESQKKAPSAHARRFMDRTKGELESMLKHAERVRAGEPQKLPSPSKRATWRPYEKGSRVLWKSKRYHIAAITRPRALGAQVHAIGGHRWSTPSTIEAVAVAKKIEEGMRFGMTIGEAFRRATGPVSNSPYKWSGKIETHWHPPAGFFERTGTQIARGLLRASSNERQAMERLNFYINRAGKNLSRARMTHLRAAKRQLMEAGASPSHVFPKKPRGFGPPRIKQEKSRFNKGDEVVARWNLKGPQGQSVDAGTHGVVEGGAGHRKLVSWQMGSRDSFKGWYDQEALEPKGSGMSPRRGADSAYRSVGRGIRVRIDHSEHAKLTMEDLKGLLTIHGGRIPGDCLVEVRRLQTKAWEQGRSPAFAANTIYHACRVR